MNIKNIFGNIPADLPDELFDELVNGREFSLERIVSRRHASDKDFLYDQDENEWVILLQGSAGLSFEGKEEPVVLHPGDYILIPQHLKHRVEWTDPACETVWLAVHYK